MGRLQWPELIIILVIVLLLFGATRLPSIARSLGSSAREFKAGLEDDNTSEEEESQES